ncbi:tRNA-modifying protein YgfZ [Vibrio salinus]|uniref:tRNA-modifying protein YgfZ n=1 Tax=Vibrio salinus TaxID=2899784 RepID=UPI001E41D38B|nr:tRNA-modifying protein YgfZ [Vibrio salinus]MCE0493427.1 tRNA-modifying protein YgfZ [Vibrio salinus]
MDWKNRFQSLPLHPQEETQSDLQLAYLESWGLITATGPDSKSFLQGQITCNVSTLTEKDLTFSAHCDAKGKVWSVFRLFHHKDGYAMLQPNVVMDVELRELKKYAVFSKVELKASADIIFSVTGRNASDYINQLSKDEGKVRKISGGTAVEVATNRWALIVDSTDAEMIVDQFKGELVHENTWLLAEIKDGIPVLNQQEQNTHIPQALNLQGLNGISFTKGCYTGQETVARAKYRGINKRALFTLKGILESSDNDVEIERTAGENWRTAGQLMSFCRLANNQAIGQIVLPNNLDDNTQFRVKGGHSNWELVAIPYSLDEDE